MKPEQATEAALRGRLEHALRFDLAHDGSLYLNTLGAVYLAAPEEAEPALSDVFKQQAAAERVNGDVVLNALCLAVPS